MEIGGVAPGARHDLAAPPVGDRGARDGPLRRGDRPGGRGDDLDPAEAAHEVAVADRNLPVAALRAGAARGELDLGRIDPEPPRGEFGEEVPEPGTGRPEMFAGIRHRPAAEGADVPRAEIGVPHGDRHLGRGEPELLGDEEAEGRRGALPEIDLSRERPGPPILAEMDPRAAVRGPPGGPGAAGRAGRLDDHEAVPEPFEIRPLRDLRPVERHPPGRAGHGATSAPGADRAAARRTASRIRR